MQAYVDTVLYLSTASIVGAADKYARKTSVFRSNGSFTLKSSLANGHALAAIFPQYSTYQAGTFYTWYEDGGVNLDVITLPVVASLTPHNTGASFNFSTYYSYVRLVSFEVTFTYIGNELNGSGESSIGSTNETLIVVGTNIKAAIQDMAFNSHDRAEHTFRQIWIPQDDSDFILRSPTLPEKGQLFGGIYFAATGLPKATDVYDVEFSAVIEGIPIATSTDFIPRSLSAPIDVEGALLKLKTALTNDPTLVTSTGGNCRHKYMKQGQMPGAVE